MDDGMTFARVRQAIEDMRCEVCGAMTCGTAEAVTALDELERALVENVQKPLDEGYTTRPVLDVRLYEDQFVNFAHGHLATILNSPATAPGESEQQGDSSTDTGGALNSGRAN